MQQFDNEELSRIPIDLNDMSLPESARVLMPVLFHDGDKYCVVLGPDPQEGVFGCGDNPEAALRDWDNHVQERRHTPAAGDEVACYINHHLGVPDMPFETPGVKGLA